MGGYEQPKTPDDPCILQMISCPYSDEVGLSRDGQYKKPDTDALRAARTARKIAISRHACGAILTLIVTSRALLSTDGRTGMRWRVLQIQRDLDVSHLGFGDC